MAKTLNYGVIGLFYRPVDVFVLKMQMFKSVRSTELFACPRSIAKSQRNILMLNNTFSQVQYMTSIMISGNNDYIMTINQLG